MLGEVDAPFEGNGHKWELKLPAAGVGFFGLTGIINLH